MQTHWMRIRLLLERCKWVKGKKTVGRHAPLFELGVDDSVGEAFAADTNAFQHTVTLQLVQDQFRIHHTWRQ